MSVDFTLTTDISYDINELYLKLYRPLQKKKEKERGGEKTERRTEIEKLFVLNKCYGIGRMPVLHSIELPLPRMTTTK